MSYDSDCVGERRKRVRRVDSTTSSIKQIKSNDCDAARSNSDSDESVSMGKLIGILSRELKQPTSSESSSAFELLKIQEQRKVEEEKSKQLERTLELKQLELEILKTQSRMNHGL
jgi:hypothetical protein